MEFKEWDWVTDERGRIGRIKRVGASYVWVAMMWNENGIPIRQDVSFQPEELTPAPLTIQEEDYKDIMDIALSTNDTEWAKDLYEKMYKLF